jgi:formate-dependent nitrite reductase membrane component NrfD
MKTSLPYGVDNESFVMGYRTQTEWRWLIPCAFFLGGLGGGTFMVALFTKSLLAAEIGWAIAVIGKGIVHFAYLGNPLRFWRAIMRPQSSWISRGILGMIGLAVFGAIYIQLARMDAGAGVVTTFAVLAGICAFVVMVYDGMVIATPPSIPLWHNAIMPVLAAAYSLLGGTTINLLLAEARTGELAESVITESSLHSLELGLVVFNFLLLSFLLMISWNASATARESVILLIQRYGILFFGGVVLVGLALVGVLAVAAELSVGILLAIAVCELVGDFLVWFTLLNSGVYQPINPRASFAR